MIQGILTYQFELNKRPSGEIEPEFKPLKLIFNKEANKFTQNDYSELITMDDIFGIFYQHTTGVSGTSGDFSNFYSGRLKETPYQVISFYKQLHGGQKFLSMSIFDTDDELEIFEDLVKSLAEKLEVNYETYIRAINSRQLELIQKINDKLEEEIKFIMFQIERLSDLSKTQKAALIFHSEERLKILETLRERPISKREMKQILERIKPNPNIDILIEPFLELNLIRRDWITGEGKKRRRVLEENLKGEFLFLVKDIILSRKPSEKMLNELKESKPEIYEEYHKKVVDFFAEYDPLEQVSHGLKDSKLLASYLLNPDIYDFIQLLRERYYPLDKIPKILSAWANFEEIMEDLRYLNLITEIEDKAGKTWLILFTDIEPITIFPEYLLPKIKDLYHSKDRKSKITEEIVEKALDLLEITYNEKIVF